MKAFIYLSTLITLTLPTLSACHNDAGIANSVTTQNPKAGNIKEDSKPVANETQTQEKSPIPPTTNDVLNDFKALNSWQPLNLNQETIMDNWQLLTVSDKDYNDLHLPIVQKRAFSFELSQSPHLHNYWLYMPNNCNSMSGQIIFTKTGIKAKNHLMSTQILCKTEPKELDDDLVHTAILKGNYQLYKKDKQHLLKISHNEQYWFFYSIDPKNPYGLLKSFKKDRHNFKVIPFSSSHLLNEWRLYAISDKDYNPIQLDSWQKNADERYLIQFNTDNHNANWLILPNQCNVLKIPFDSTPTGIMPHTNHIISTQAKCDTKTHSSDESFIHTAIYNGQYTLMQNLDNIILIISYNDHLLFFITNDDNTKQKNP